MKILHIITGLTQGGAESALFRLVTYKKDINTIHVVISMVDMGVYGEQLANENIEVHMLGMQRGRLSIKAVGKLWRLLKQIKPDIVQTWMYHADLIGGIVARLAGFPNICWGIVHFNLDPGVADKSTRWTASACALLSYLIPKKIISCSQAANPVHKKIGYDISKFCTIPLGYDLNELVRNETARNQLRNQWGIPKDAILIGCLARWNPQKDHQNLLKAFAIVSEKYPDTYCFLAGREIDNNNQELVELITITNDGNNKLFLLGVIDHISSIMSAIDIHVLSSIGEAFPNVVAESMACETPCVVTNVGDTKQIVGELGWVVPSSDSAALANAIMLAIVAIEDKQSWEIRKKMCRQVIIEKYSMERMVESYCTTWKSLLTES